MLTLHLSAGAIGLLPQRAAYLCEHGALLVADAHFGKAHSFRRLGVPVPEATTHETLQRLGAAVQATGARELIFLGDLLHSAHAQWPVLTQALLQWKAQHPSLAWTLVRGNHDAHAGDPAPELGMAVVNEPYALGAWRLCHHPRSVAGGYALAGHVHPGVTLHGRAGRRVRLPAFRLGDELGVLPAFGAFTGMASRSGVRGERVFAVLDDQVHELKV